MFSLVILTILDNLENFGKYFYNWAENNVKMFFCWLSGDARYPLLGQPLQYNPPAVLHGHIPTQQVWKLAAWRPRLCWQNIIYVLQRVQGPWAHLLALHKGDLCALASWFISVVWLRCVWVWPYWEQTREKVVCSLPEKSCTSALQKWGQRVAGASEHPCLWKTTSDWS